MAGLQLACQPYKVDLTFLTPLDVLSQHFLETGYSSCEAQSSRARSWYGNVITTMLFSGRQGQHTHSKLSWACGRNHVRQLAPHLNSQSSAKSPVWKGSGSRLLSFLMASAYVTLVTCLKQVLAPVAYRKAMNAYSVCLQ